MRVLCLTILLVTLALTCTDEKLLVRAQLKKDCQPISNDFYDYDVKEYTDIKGTQYLMLALPEKGKWWLIKAECIQHIKQISAE